MTAPPTKTFQAGPRIDLGHAVPTFPVAVGIAADGKSLVFCGRSDGTVGVWDTTGTQMRPPIDDHVGDVNALAFGISSDGHARLASAGDDGTIGLWDPTSGGLPAVPVSAARVLSLAFSHGNVPMLLAYGCDDGTIGFLDPFTETFEAREPLTGHTGAVNSVALAVTLEGALLASGSDDGTVRLWDPLFGTSRGAPLTGHTGRVLSVAFGSTPEGILLASGSDDGTIRLWDTNSGTPRGAPLVHTAAVNGVTFVPSSEDRTLLASCSDDGTLRVWRLSAEGTASSVVNHTTERTGRLLSVAVGATPDGSVLAYTDEDGGVTVSPVAPTVVEQNGERQATTSTPTAPALRTDAPAVVDDTETRDELGRDILAAHLEVLLDQLTDTSRSAGDNQGSAVVHIDGQWGSGKTTLVTLLRRRLTSPTPTDGRAGPDTTRSPAAGRLADPIIIAYNAWRESAIAPEWWSLATAINRAVRHERAGTTRVWMTLCGTVIRMWRSPPVVVSIALLAAVLATRAARLWQDAGAISTWITALTAVTALGLAAGRVLFWTSPAFGRLYVRADDNPLGEIAATVGRLRRWAPRTGRRHRLADSLLGIWIVFVVLVTVRILIERRSARKATTDTLGWIQHHEAPALVSLLLVVVAVTGWSWHQTKSSDPTAAEAPRSTGTQPPTWLGSWARDPSRAQVLTFRVSIIALVGAAAWFATTSVVPAAIVATFGWHPELSAVVLLALGSAAHAWWSIHGGKRNRRPLILVIDDLDRCSAERTVRLLETVHTLLLHRASSKLLPQWRAPAPMIVLVLADGRWVRTAFEKSYEAFDRFDSSVHGLGADFVHKLFHHTVLVPALAARQISDILDVFTDSPKATSRTQADTSRARDDAIHALDNLAPGSLRSTEMDEILTRTPLTAQDAIDVETARVEREAGPAATTERAAHLLTEYAELMPANPRLVKRVANVWGMLCALQSHLHPGRPANAPPDDHVARAAIMFVRFPALVDELLSCSSPPELHEKTVQPPPYYPPPPPSPWLRPDVRQLLRAPDGTDIEPRCLASCYGREFAPGRATPRSAGTVATDDDPTDQNDR
jgi:KAP family P-loop domain/WD domain, G-beta repeat